jgi:multiple sugar transport system permease protein
VTAERRLGRALATLALLAACGVLLFPYLWMLLATFKDNREIFGPFPLLPSRFHLDHYRALLDGRFIPFPRHLLNSLLIATGQTLGVLLLSVPAGFVLGRYRFGGARPLRALCVASVFVPQQVLALPLFVWLHRLGLIDTLAAALLPGLASGLGVVYFAHLFRRMPGELADLARSEGASEYQVFCTLLPLARPALAAFGLVHFVLAWHEHLVPLVMLHTPENKTVPVALAGLYGSTLRMPYALLMVGGLLATLPTVALYLAVRRGFHSALAELTER